MAETKIRILFRTWQRLFPMVKTKSNVIFYKRNNFRTTTAKFVESIENRQKGERKDEANMLRKKTSRVIAFLMTMLLLTGGLTGCKGNPDPIDDPSSLRRRYNLAGTDTGVQCAGHFEHFKRPDKQTERNHEQQRGQQHPGKQHGKGYRYADDRRRRGKRNGRYAERVQKEISAGDLENTG